MKLLIVIINTIFLLIVSCAQGIKNHDIYQIKQCKLSCQQKNIICRKLCYDNCFNCIKIDCKKAKRSYNEYVREQFIVSGIIVRRLNSYRDPLQCLKTTCDCCADYRVCQQSCR